MKTPQQGIVPLAMERQRLSLPDLASELGVAVDVLLGEDLGGRLVVRLSEMVKTAPEPLAAVADLPAEEQAQMGKGLVADVTRLANQRLSLEKDLATMRHQYEVAVRGLNDLREHVKGVQVVARYAHLPQGNWKAVRPLEIELEATVAANNGRARQTKMRELAQVKAGLAYIKEEQLPEYEAQYGELPAVEKAFANLAQGLKDQAEALAEYRQSQEALEAEMPLVFAPNGKDLSLRTQQPHEATAQALAEEAVAACKAAESKDLRNKQRPQQQARKAREVELVEETFDSLLPRLQAGENPGRPGIAPAALNPKLLKGSPAALLARQPRKAQPTSDLLLPKTIRIKAPDLEEGEQVAAPVAAPTHPAGQAKNISTPGPAATTVAAPTSPAASAKPTGQTQPTAQPQAGPEAEAVSTAQPTPATQAPAPEPEPDDGFMDDGWRPDGWLMEVDEPVFQQYFGSHGGIFPSKALRDEALNTILEGRLEEEERQRKEAEWERQFMEDDDDPPDK